MSVRVQCDRCCGTVSVLGPLEDGQGWWLELECGHVVRDDFELSEVVLDAEGPS